MTWFLVGFLVGLVWGALTKRWLTVPSRQDHTLTRLAVLKQLIAKEGNDGEERPTRPTGP